MSGELDSREGSQPMKLEWRLQILAKLGLRELCDSKLFGLDSFHNMAISLSQKRVKN